MPTNLWNSYKWYGYSQRQQRVMFFRSYYSTERNVCIFVVWEKYKWKSMLSPLYGDISRTQKIFFGKIMSCAQNIVWCARLSISCALHNISCDLPIIYIPPYPSKYKQIQKSNKKPKQIKIPKYKTKTHKTTTTTTASKQQWLLYSTSYLNWSPSSTFVTAVEYWLFWRKTTKSYYLFCGVYFVLVCLLDHFVFPSLFLVDWLVSILFL